MTGRPDVPGPFRGELWQVPVTGDRTPVPLVQNSFLNAVGKVSPDGRWLAYQSDEAGHYDVYVRPLQSQGGRIRLSTSGGRIARWRADGNELFYLSLDNVMTAVSLNRNGDSLHPETPTPLFRLAASNHDSWSATDENSYEVARDGQSFLIRVPIREAPEPSMTVVVNWPAVLRH